MREKVGIAVEEGNANYLTVIPQQVKCLINGIVFPILAIANRTIKESRPMRASLRHFIAGSVLFLTCVHSPAKAFDLIIPAYANPCCDDM